MEFYVYENQESFYFYTIKNGIILPYIDLWSNDFNDIDLSLKLEKIQIRYNFYNFDSKIINYELLNQENMSQLLKMIKSDLIKYFFHKNIIDHHYLTSIIKNENEKTWYLCWND